MNIETMILHFKRSFQAEIQAGAEAINNGDDAALGGLLDRLAENPYVQHFRTVLATAHDRAAEFKETLKELGLLGELVYGISFVVGGCLFAGSSELLALILVIVGGLMLINVSLILLAGLLKKLTASLNEASQS